MRYLHFDKKGRPSHQLQIWLMSDVWGGFVADCIACYKPGANIILDKQLFPTIA